MPNCNDDIKSQFEKNYLGDVDLEKFCEKTGVKYYHVCLLAITLSYFFLLYVCFI